MFGRRFDGASIDNFLQVSDPTKVRLGLKGTYSFSTDHW
jgi:hypothetical protein